MGSRGMHFAQVRTGQYNTFLHGGLAMYNRAANQIITLLDAGQETQARALFMQHLAAHCRKIDCGLGKILEKDSYTDERLWQVFLEVHHIGWFSLSA
jgi:hypothetical protein